MSAREDFEELLAATFGGAQGPDRLAQACEAYDACVGAVFDDDAHAGDLGQLRAQWAFCEVRLDDGLRWVDRCARGQIDGADVEAARRLACSHAGVFEVWIGRETVLRDRLSGLCLRLLDKVELVRHEEDEVRANTLWDARVIVVGEGARLCADPLVYPDELRAALDEAQALRRPGPSGIKLPQVRRALLRWQRARGRRAFVL